MPELPEVETMRRGLLPLIGSRISDVSRPRCLRKPITITPGWNVFRRRLKGRTITGLDRVGKRVVVELDDVNRGGDRLIFEPRMTGLVLLANPPTQEHLRLIVEFDSSAGSSLMYWDRRGLGLVRLVSPAEFTQRYLSGEIGPDALKITADELRLRLVDSRRPIKVALLDQRALAGVGNLYASELLFLAGIDPRQRCDQLRSADWQRLHRSMLDILTDAILHEGSTLSDGTYRNALNQTGGYQNHHRVYDRAGEPCPLCTAPIERIVQAQRSTFFCKQCQNRRAKPNR